MAVSSVGLRPKSDCSGKAQKQLYSKLQTNPLVREGAPHQETSNRQTSGVSIDRNDPNDPDIGLSHPQPNLCLPVSSWLLRHFSKCKQ
jgi:hypothetical protein